MTSRTVAQNYAEIKAERDAYLASQGQTSPNYDFDVNDETGDQDDQD